MEILTLLPLLRLLLFIPKSSVSVDFTDKLSIVPASGPVAHYGHVYS